MNMNTNIQNNTQNNIQNNIQNILKKYPDKIPIIVKKDPRSLAPDIEKSKFLVPKDLSVAQFIYIIRKRIKLEPEKAIFLYFGNNNILPSCITVEEAYYKYKKDDVLYATYTSENTFG